MNRKQLYIETFGCQMNVNDSERIVTMLRGIGYDQTTDRDRADLILFNTCTVRGGAADRVYQHIENLKTLKKRRPGVLIGIGGCVAQQDGRELLDRYPWLDIVIGTHNLHLLPDIVADALSGKRRCETDFLESGERRDLFPPIDGERRISSFVTVMQGCDNFCTYCIVPYVRGREISRRFDEVVSEVRDLAGAGVREVVLLGQNVNSYGAKKDGVPPFADLIRAVADIDGILRIRFTTSHPKDMSDELIACFANLPKLCGAIQLPAQSGSDRILARMNRGYTRDAYLSLIRRLRAARPGIQVTGDIIVGFPGETDDDFDQTISLMDEVRYFDLFYFAYSPRPGTKASEFTDDVSKDVKQARLMSLQDLQRSHTRAHNDGYLGTVQKVLVEGAAKREGQMTGRIDSGRIVNFAGSADLSGKMVDVRIIESFQNSLLGETA